MAVLRSPLLIGVVDGSWTVQIANVPDISYTFKGDTLDDQRIWLDQFNSQMVADDGAEAVMALSGVTDAEAAQVSAQLFGTTNSLILGEDVLITAGEGSMLSDIMDVAGQALLEALVAF
jgi:hypothetical protein